VNTLKRVSAKLKPETAKLR